MNEKARVLVIDDSAMVLRAVKKILSPLGGEIEASYAENLVQAKNLFLAGAPDAIVSDIILPDGTGLELLDFVKKSAPDLPVIMMTADPSIDSVIQAIRLGAYNYIVKPFSDEYFLKMTRQAIDFIRMTRENQAYRVHLEELVAKRTAELEKAHRKIQQEEELRRRLITLAAHELRTPVTSLVGMVQMMAPQKPGDRFFELLVRSSRRVTTLLNTLIPQMENPSGAPRLTPTRFTLRELFDSVVEEFTPFVKEKGQSIEATCEPFEIATDLEKVRQGVTNLLLNAIKYSPMGGKILLRGEASRGGSGVAISVEDFGPGVKIEHRDFIFDRLTSFDDVNKYSSKFNFEKSYGLGMGLYLARKFASAIGGTVSLVAKDPPGARFLFDFPTRLPADSLD